MAPLAGRNPSDLPGAAPAPNPSARRRALRRSIGRAGLLLLATAVLSVLIVRHTPGLDGPKYARWGWHAPRPIWGPFALCAAVFGIALLLHWRLCLPSQRSDRPLRRAVAIPVLLLMLSSAGFIATAAPGVAETRSFHDVISLIESPMAISYFADAAALHEGPGDARDWLSNYPSLLPQMFLHSREKPPGLVLFFAAFIHFFGVSDRAAVGSAIVLLGLIPLGIPATYFLARQLGASSAQAFQASACITLFPSLVRFYPGLDALWIGATALMLGLWARGLRQNSLRASAGFGAVLAGTLFCVYNVLVIGALVVAYAAVLPPRGTRLIRFIRHAAVALGVLAAFYVALALATGFNPIATFAAALENQAHLARSWNRPYPWTIPFDLADFVLGTGWLGTLLAVFAVIHRPDHGLGDVSGSNSGISRSVVLLGLLEVVLVALTGLLPAETARVWAFLTPLVAIPAGIELARWPRATRTIAYVCMLLILALLAANLISAESHLLGS